MSSSLKEIAGIITEKATLLSELIDAQGLEHPTSERKGYNGYSGEDFTLRQARYDLARASRDLLRLAEGPEDQLLHLSWASTDTANLGILIRFEVPQNVPMDSTVSANELSRKVSLPEDTLLRILRYAVGTGLFDEPSPGCFGHNAVSAALAHSESLRAIALMSTHELSRMLLRLPDWLVAKQDHANGPQAAFNLELPDYSNVFEFLSKNPAAAKRYHGYMVGRAMTDRWSPANMAKAWDWARVGSKTIIDVGGSEGHTVVALASCCPDAKFVIQDVDPVALERGRQMLSATDSTLRQRVEYVRHDFFQPQTHPGDIFLFRHIFHDWSDDDTIKILKGLVPVLKKGATILVCEGIVPAPPSKKTNTLDEKQILVEDMFMLAVHDGRERSVENFVSLFHRADSRYHYVRTTGGENGAFQSIVEFEFQG